MSDRTRWRTAADRLAPTTFTIVIVLIAAFTSACGQDMETGFLDRSTNVDGVAFPYQVYVPRDHDRSRSWPVILALHGGGEYGDDGVQHTRVGLANAIRQYPERFPAVVVFPQSRNDGTPGWQQAGGRAALAALDESIAEFNGDRARVYLTGYSAGGNGSWYLASRYPERFAALLVICGWVSARQGTVTPVFYPALAPGADPFSSVAQRVSTLPIWIFHGDADQTVSVEESRRMASALENLRADVQYTELRGVGHDAWDIVYERADVFSWLLQKRRAVN